MSDRADAKHSFLADKVAPPTVKNIADNNHSPKGLLKNVTPDRVYLRFRAFWILAYLGILGTANLAVVAPVAAPLADAGRVDDRHENSRLGGGAGPVSRRVRPR